MDRLVHALALAGIAVSVVGVVVMVFRAPSTEYGWGGGKYAVPLPVLVVELVLAVRDQRRAGGSNA